jgi:hypothetical protein
MFVSIYSATAPLSVFFPHHFCAIQNQTVNNSFKRGHFGEVRLIPKTEAKIGNLEIPGPGLRGKWQPAWTLGAEESAHTQPHHQTAPIYCRPS